MIQRFVWEERIGIWTTREWQKRGIDKKSRYQRVINVQSKGRWVSDTNSYKNRRNREKVMDSKESEHIFERMAILRPMEEKREREKRKEKVQSKRDGKNEGYTVKSNMGTEKDLIQRWRISRFQGKLLLSSASLKVELEKRCGWEKTSGSRSWKLEWWTNYLKMI